MKNMKKRDIVIMGVIIMLLLSLCLLFFLGQTKEVFKIEDRCGPVMNLISHSVGNDGVCKTRCMSQCETRGLQYSSHVFNEANLGCHDCTCSCKKGFLS